MELQPPPRWPEVAISERRSFKNLEPASAQKDNYFSRPRALPEPGLWPNVPFRTCKLQPQYCNAKLRSPEKNHHRSTFARHYYLRANSALGVRNKRPPRCNIHRIECSSKTGPAKKAKDYHASLNCYNTRQMKAANRNQHEQTPNPNRNQNRKNRGQPGTPPDDAS